MTGQPIDDVSVARFRARAWDTIARIRDAAPRVPDDASTDDIIDGLIDSGLVNDLVTEAFRRGQASVPASHTVPPADRDRPRLGDLVRVTRTAMAPSCEVFEGTLALAGRDSSSDPARACDYALEDARDVTGAFTRQRGLPDDQTMWIRLHLPGQGYDDVDTIEVLERRVRFDDVADQGAAR